NRKIKEVNERGVITEYEYDDSGNLIRETAAVGTDDERTLENTYDNDGNLLTVKQIANPNTPEAITVMTYDYSGNVSTVTDPEGNLTQLTSHDIMGNILTRIDERGKTWAYTFNDDGSLATITDPMSHLTQIFYDDNGNKEREIDAEEKESRFIYDSRNNLVESVDTAGKSAFFEYNSDDLLIKETDPEGKIAWYEYDNEGRLVKSIDGNGNEIITEYDDSIGSDCSSCSGNSYSQPSKITYPTFVKEFVYDDRGRKIEEQEILSETEKYSTLFEYDSAGNLIETTDKEGNITLYEYDNLSRPVRVTNMTGSADNIDTFYGYDSKDNLIFLQDGKGNVTHFEYDRNKRVVKEIRPMGEETSYVYDEAGNTVEKTDAKGQKTEYVYDDSGRLTDVNYCDPSDLENPVKEVSFTYDNVGNMKSYDDGTTSALYDYDDVYRRIGETINYGSFSKSLSYTYYDNGLKKSFTGPDGATYNYNYNANNQLAEINIPDQGSVTYTSYNWNRPTNITLPGGSTKTYTYDPLMRVKSIVAKDPGGNDVINYQYSYDKMDNILTKDTEHGSYSYEYDDFYRLTGLSIDSITEPDLNEEFTYDKAGNRLTSADTLGDWTYNQNNELQTTPPLSSGPTGGSSFEYDSNGNMAQKTVDGVVTKFIHNLEDRLAEVRDGSDSLIAEYYYDPFGRRLWKDVDGTRVYFFYADEGLIGEYDNTGAEIKTYGYLPDSIWCTNPLFMKMGSDYYWYHNDHLGTPQMITTNSGEIVWKAKYTAFGKATVDPESTVVNPLRLAGQYEDAETGLHYNYSRYYDPVLGRFLRTDPVGFGAGDANLYGYLWNNPLNSIDPFGLWNWRAFGKGVLKGVMYTAIGVGVGVVIAATLPAAVATGIGVAFAVVGSATLGWYTGQFITGERIYYNNGFQTRRMCDGERSELAGELLVGWAAFGAYAAKKGFAAEKPIPEEPIPERIYRGGRYNDSAIKDIRPDPDGVSFRDSLSNPIPKPEHVPLKPGKPYIEVDTSKLPPGSVTVDNVPPGHVSVKATPEEIVNAIVGGGKLPK
ncbi:MAG: RHS repeat-associated core domain-containing protein, partial [Desulfobacteraceae bacterium]